MNSFAVLKRIFFEGLLFVNSSLEGGEVFGEGMGKDLLSLANGREEI